MEINKIGIDISALTGASAAEEQRAGAVESIVTPDKENKKPLIIKDIVAINKDKSGEEEKDELGIEELKPIELPEIDMIVNKAYFAVDEKAQQVVIRIVNPDGELLKQIPPEEYLKLVERMKVSYQNLFHAEV
ncbi:MAG: flagellar protein FlaG [Candidatus Magnetoovum sp. WYHC-5]|nr:flagellar protein FlaG [Candidatus Magnetoovum sp. WYHC-5]